MCASAARGRVHRSELGIADGAAAGLRPAGCAAARAARGNPAPGGRRWSHARRPAAPSTGRWRGVSRKALADRRGLRAVLRRAGAELVLHGHARGARLESVAGPGGPDPGAVRTVFLGPAQSARRGGALASGHTAGVGLAAGRACWCASGRWRPTGSSTRPVTNCGCPIVASAALAEGSTYTSGCPTASTATRCARCSVH